MISPCFYLFLLGSLCFGVFSAPADTPYKEMDPELTAGLFEGDMDIDVGLERNGVLSPSARWPNAIVPYIISDQFDALQRAQIEQAMEVIMAHSCILFVPADSNEVNYLQVITSTAGCSSQVGYAAGPRNVNLVPNTPGVGCFRLGVIQHELLHTLGFRHQQNSPDRDNYVVIMTENIQTGQENAFNKYSSSQLGNFGFGYDYKSVMHYGPYAFSKNGLPTIVALNLIGHLQMGQRINMTEVDIGRLNAMYNCSVTL